MTELVEKVQGLEVVVTKIDGRVTNLEQWQEKQNGNLQRLEMKMDNINLWLRGLMGGIIVSLVMLLLQLLKG